jgi:hypothetical protein
MSDADDEAKMAAAMAAVRDAVGEDAGFILVMSLTDSTIARCDTNGRHGRDILKALPMVAMALRDVIRGATGGSPTCDCPRCRQRRPPDAAIH